MHHQPSILRGGSSLDALAVQGWGLVVERTVGREALVWIDALAQLRAEQSGVSEVPVFEVPRGMDRAQARAWRITVYDRLPIERRPRYLLILGDLDQVSLELQQELMIDAHVGRLCFTDAHGRPDAAGYRAYCAKLVAAERAYESWCRRARLLFYTARDGSPATESGFRDLVRRCWYEARRDSHIAVDDTRIFGRRDDPAWDHSTSHPSAPEDTLLHWAGNAHPSTLLTMTHGAGVRQGDDQRLLQGALTLHTESDERRLLGHEYFAERPFLPLGFWMLEACFGAGTPSESVYRPWLERLRDQGRHADDVERVMSYLAHGEPFIARLPQAVLANPNGPLAVVGHVDLSWTHGYQRDDEPGIPGGAEHTPYYELLRAVSNGTRFGSALSQTLTHKASVIGTHLATLYGEGELATGAVGNHSRDSLRAWQWMRYLTLSSYVLLGDPAARLPVHAAGVSARWERAVSEVLCKERPAPRKRVAAPSHQLTAGSQSGARPEKNDSRESSSPDQRTRGLPPARALPLRHMPLELVPASGDDLVAGRRVYLLRDPESPGHYLQGELRWDESLRADLSGLTDMGSMDDAIARLSASMDEFTGDSSWSNIVHQVQSARDLRRGVVFSMRSAASELYALPWEFLRIRGVPICETEDCLVRYNPPRESKREIHSQPVPADKARILVAWAGAVPAREHLQVIAQAARRGGIDFDPERDQVADATSARLRAALAGTSGGLEGDAENSRPATILHLLCHGEAIDGGGAYGLSMGGASGIMTPGQLRELLEPHAQSLRLVVLSACMSGHPGTVDNQLGSLARAVYDAGVATVIASRYPLTPDDSVTITRVLYHQLLVEARSLERALLEVRSALLEHRSDGWAWAALQWYGCYTEGVDYRPIAHRPYHGREPYEIGDSRFFYGRDEVRRTLLDRVYDTMDRGAARFLLVSGASGCGKTSLVNAGLLADLLADADGRAARSGVSWRWARVSVDSMEDRILAVRAAVANQRADWARERDDDGAHAHASRPLLALFIDRLEEVFTDACDMGERMAFMQMLRQLATEPDGDIFVICAGRASCLDEVAKACRDEFGIPFVRELLDRDHRYHVPALDDAGYAEIIRGPCHAVGTYVEPGLCQRLVGELRSEPGALPLLATVMERLWQGRELATLEVPVAEFTAGGRARAIPGVVPEGGQRIRVRGWWVTDRSYDELGGIGALLALEAETVLASLSRAERTQARRLLVQLVHGHEDHTLATRRRGYRHRMRPCPWSHERAANAYESALDAFVAARIIVEGGVDLERHDNGATLDLAHDCLVRSWTRLSEWHREAHPWLAHTDNLRVAAQAWLPHANQSWLFDARPYGTVVESLATHGLAPKEHEDDYLLRGRRLACELENWRRYGSYLGEEDQRLIKAFLDACVRARNARERSTPASHWNARLQGLSRARDGLRALGCHDIARSSQRVQGMALLDGIRTTVDTHAERGVRTLEPRNRRESETAPVLDASAHQRLWALLNCRDDDTDIATRTETVPGQNGTPHEAREIPRCGPALDVRMDSCEDQILPEERDTIVSMEPDEVLLERWRAGNRPAGEELFKRHSHRVIRFFSSKVIESDVKDLTQEVFVAICRGKEKISSSKFVRYLMGTAKNIFLQYLRRKYRNGHSIDIETCSIEELGPSPRTLARQKREQRLLLEALRKMPIISQLILELRYWEGMRTKEIAEIVSMPDNSVRSHLVRANAKLRSLIDELASSPEDLQTTVTTLDDWAKKLRDSQSDDDDE